MTDTRTALADAMCKHALTGDWFEKADEVIDTLADVGFVIVPDVDHTCGYESCPHITAQEAP